MQFSKENINFCINEIVAENGGIDRKRFEELLHQNALVENIVLLQKQLCEYIFKEGDKEYEL